MLLGRGTRGGGVLALDFVSIVSPVIKLFQTQFTLFGITTSYWDVLVWCLVAGIVISFIKGLLTGDE